VDLDQGKQEETSPSGSTESSNGTNSSESVEHILFHWQGLNFLMKEVMEQHVDLASKADQIEEKARLLQKPPDTLVIRNRAYCSITAPCTVCR
jgi:hypothetical protein